MKATLILVLLEQNPPLVKSIYLFFMGALEIEILHVLLANLRN